VLLDSNVIIYASLPLPESEAALEFIETQSPRVSAISYLEALGYHRLTQEARDVLTSFFSRTTLIPIDPPILQRAVDLRQQRRMSLGDSIVAATALVHRMSLVTRNTDDFNWVPGLDLFNPFEAPPASPH
jgi:toxin FitB